MCRLGPCDNNSEMIEGGLITLAALKRNNESRMWFEDNEFEFKLAKTWRQKYPGHNHEDMALNLAKCYLFLLNFAILENLNSELFDFTI